MQTGILLSVRETPEQLAAQVRRAEQAQQALREHQALQAQKDHLEKMAQTAIQDQLVQRALQAQQVVREATAAMERQAQLAQWVQAVHLAPLAIRVKTAVMVLMGRKVFPA